MRSYCLAAIVLALCGPLKVAVSQAADEPIGTWKVRTTFEGRGGRVSILKLQMDGENLTGAMLHSDDANTEIQNAHYEEGNLSFEVPRQWNGQVLTTRYAGRFQGDTIQGTVEYQRRGLTRTLNWEATRTTPEALARDVEIPPVAADIELNDQNYEAWRDHILPASNELAWEQIPWLTTFMDGILAADAAAKPLLFWTMNGHPLSCT